MSDTLEIPRERWADYLNALGNRELNHGVRIRTEGPELGDQPLAEALPLVGISLEQKGSEAGAIEITLGRSTGENYTHVIARPTHMYVEQEGEMVRCLDIEDNARVKTLIFFDETKG